MALPLETQIPRLEPRLPARAPRVWHCTGCPKVLGLVRGDKVEIAHAGRRIVAPLPCSQVCDDCKTLNMITNADDLPS